ncbi:Utp14-domain-containing protein [Epithele typhae]|uniref:Utp14-domain-containing protein n=1 Tax=Epithele typhae TaxID=378194 RepID=UPI0020080891|nr:Utp14-domain-containing protein [Epithele typhae]KAH9932099.1 Utp14-domain-containing protein [Epithele typhae]
MVKGRGPKEAPRSRKTASTLGYAKRQSLKSKTLRSQGVSDVYEYQQEKVRRANVKPLLARDEEAEMGGGAASESDDGAARKSARPRLVGEDDGDEGIGEDEDEDIDSDEAFEESDEDRFAGFSFAQKGKSQLKARSKAKKKDEGKSRAVRFADVNLNEDDESDEDERMQDGPGDEEEEDEEEEEGDPDEFIDVLDVLDGRGEPDLGEEEQTKSARHRGEHAQEDEEEKDRMDGDEDGDGDDEDDEEEEDDEHLEADGAISASGSEDEGGALQDLETFVTGLDAGQKRKTLHDDEVLEDSGKTARPRKRRLLPERTEAGAENEFISGTGGGKLGFDDLLAPLEGQSSNLASLKKPAKILTSTSGKIKTLSAPLPTRVAERLDREAAYELTKEEVDKWKTTMQRITDAEHLSFPLQAEPKSRTSNLELAAKFKPSNELESAVDKLLKSAKLREDEIAQTEALKMNHLSVEEVSARRAELTKMRDLMFRAEAKAKRLAKIKSKTYRRIRKKEKARLADKLHELGGEDDEDDEERRVQREVERARERATLRHKNTGKGEDGSDERARTMRTTTMKEMGRVLSRIKAKAFDELAALDTDDAEAPSARRARDLRYENPRNKARPIQSPLNGGGRVVYRPGVLTGGVRPVGSLASDTSSVTLKSTDLLLETRASRSPPDSPDSPRPRPVPTSGEPQENPWLVGASSAATAGQTRHEVAVSKGSAVADKSKSKLRKRVQKRAEEREKAQADAEVDIETSATMSLAGPASSSASVQRGRGKGTAPAARAPAGDESDSDANSEVEAQERSAALKAKGKGKVKAKGDAKGVKAFEQRDLVALAFAGDNVVQDFADAKRREVAADAPKEVDTTLPGWVSLSVLALGRHWHKESGAAATPGEDPTGRRAGRARGPRQGARHHLERRDKKAARYLVKDLPHPYTSAAQFARSMEVPLGAEWNTRVGFQRATLPRVVTKMGTLIAPLEKLQ